MAIQTFDELYGQTMELYGQQAFGDALTLLTEHGERFPEHAPMILYLRSCLAARSEQPELALDLVQQALDRGFWYGEQVMRETPSWQSFQGLPAFERLAEINIARERAAQAEPQLLTKEPAQGCTEERACPLFVALHGNGDTAANTLVAWETVTDWGWLLAAPQSSQLLTVNSPVWNNQEIAVRDVAQHYAALQTQFNIDSERCIVAGFSMGGETALRVALSGTIPARGFVLLGPGGPTIETPDAWLPLIEQGAARGMRGYIFVGEEDTGIPQDRIRSLVELLNTHNLPCVFETLPDLRHVYPPDFAPALDRALSFIESQTDKN